MGKYVSPSSTTSAGSVDPLLEAMRDFVADGPVEDTSAAPEPVKVAPASTPTVAPVPAPSAAQPAPKAPSAPESAPTSEPKVDTFKKDPGESWGELGRRASDWVFQNPPTVQEVGGDGSIKTVPSKGYEAQQARGEARTKREEEAAKWQGRFDQEVKDLHDQLAIDGKDIPIPLVDLGDRKGLKINEVARTLAYNELDKRVRREFGSHYDWATAYGAMKDNGVPESEIEDRMKVMEFEADQAAHKKIKLALADKKHMVAVTLDNDGLIKTLAEYNQTPISERTRIPYTPVGIVPLPVSTADIMAILSPKEWTVSSHPGETNPSMTVSEIKGESPGDYIPRVAFDLFQASWVARDQIFKEKGGSDILTTAVGTVERDGNLGDKFPEARRAMPFNPLWNIPIFAQNLNDGDVGAAWDTYVEASAAANGYGRTQEEKEAYIRRVRENPAFRDELQKEFVSLTTETWDSMYGEPPPEELVFAMGTVGYGTGMIGGDFVAPDPVIILTVGASELGAAGYRLHKLRQADTLVAKTEELVANPAVSIDELRKTIALESPAFADHQYTAGVAATRTNAGGESGLSALQREADDALTRAKKLQEDADKLPAETAEAVKKVGDEAKQAVADAQWTEAGNAAGRKKGHAKSLKTAKQAEADRVMEEAKDLFEQAELLRTQEALAKAKKAIEDYRAGNDPVRASVEKAYKEADKLSSDYDKLRTIIQRYAKDNADIIDEVAPYAVEAERAFDDVLRIGDEYGDALQASEKAKAVMVATATDAAKAKGPKKLSYQKQVQMDAKAFQQATAKAEAIKARLDAAKAATLKAREILKNISPEKQKVWKKLMALQDQAADAYSTAAAQRKLLKDLFGDEIPDSMLAADTAIRKQLVHSYGAAKEAMKAQAVKAGGTASAAAKAKRAVDTAQRLLDQVRIARQVHAGKAAQKVQHVAAKGAKQTADTAIKGEEALITLKGKASDTAQTAADLVKQKGAWRDAAVQTAKRYRDGLRMAPAMHRQARATATSKKLITEGLLKSDASGFVADTPKLLARLQNEIGEGGIKWLSEQTTDTGQAVKKLLDATGPVALTPQEVRALEQGHEGYNNARVMGHAKRDDILTYNTVSGLEAIEHTKAVKGFRKNMVGTLARWARAFDQGAIPLGTINDTMPAIARAAANKGAQAKDELAFVKTRGTWKNVTAYGKEALRELGVPLDEAAEGATHAGMIFDYLGTTKAVIYSSGGTLLNTSTVTGKSLFEQFRMQVLADARVSEFVAKAVERAQAGKGEELPKLVAEYADTTAPYLLAVTRAWYPSNVGKIDPITDAYLLRDMILLLQKSADEATDLPKFVSDMRDRVRKPPQVTYTKTVNGVETQVNFRPPSMAGIGSSDTDIVRVTGFLGDAISHGSNLYETEHMLTKALGGVIDADTMKHVDRFITGEFAGKDGPVDIAKVMGFFNRVGMPMTNDAAKIKDWAGKVGERAVRTIALQRDPKLQTWITAPLVKSLDADLGKVVKTLEERTRYDQTPELGTAAKMVNLWRRSVTIGYLTPNPTFFVGNYLGNITQTWTVLGAGKAAQLAFADSFTNVPVVGKAVQDYTSRMSAKHKDTPVVGPVIEWLFNPHISGVMSGEKGWVKMRNGAVIDYDTLRREAIEHGVVDTMLREDLSSVFARHRDKGAWAGVKRALWGETGYHRAMSDFQTMTQQRSRMGLYLRLRDEGYPAAEAGKKLNDALFDWKHGAPAIHSFMNILPFWRFFALGHRQAFRAQMQGFYDSRGALGAALIGQSQMGNIRQQRAVMQAIEDTFLPEQQGPYATLEEQQMAEAANLDPSYNHDKVRFGLFEVPPGVQFQMMKDSGRAHSHMMLTTYKPTTIAFLDTQFSFMAAMSAQVYAGSIGVGIDPLDGNVAPRGMGAMKEAVASVADDTVPWLSDPIQKLLYDLGVSSEDGGSSKYETASRGQAQLLEKVVNAGPGDAQIGRTLLGMIGVDPEGLIWKQPDGTYKMHGSVAVLLQSPWTHEIVKWHARTALNPWRLQDNEEAVNQVTILTLQSLGFGPVFYSPAQRIDRVQKDAQYNITGLVPPESAIPHGGWVEPTKNDGEVDR